MASVSVRYIVSEVDPALAFYRDALGFEVVMQPAPTFAILARGELRLLLSAPVGRGGGAQPSLDGHAPEPGGWNRFQLEVADLAGETARLREMGVRFRTDLSSASEVTRSSSKIRPAIRSSSSRRRLPTQRFRPGRTKQ